MAAVIACSSRGWARPSSVLESETMSLAPTNQCFSIPFRFADATITASVTTCPSSVRPVSILKRFRTSSSAAVSRSGSIVWTCSLSVSAA